ncbi:SOS response-associated peptidase [Microbacterium sp. zg.B48]|uniref:SOS response-associated peptidase n=1 Tax=unclassified Microbacterium TaxID=2609290 RepID=UPI00214C678F|nr:MULTISPECIES: SOS response-associated peptidase [unclassified Microbacterium]MCR2761900.1 SOS response-associated peptidase [Microbacterium sp. zg.B48]MCR2811183.1 SOS response-associated peptidase [Microbacterium sp. zg.B185]WIM20983.1 SOS response-associated peptidase [Microbacterium sp. zg-B185]
MCGRFALNAKTDELIRDFVVEGGDFREWTPRYSVAPTQTERQPREDAWGLAADVAGTHEPSVRGDLGVRRVFAQGAEEVMRETGDHEGRV